MGLLHHPYRPWRLMVGCCRGVAFFAAIVVGAGCGSMAFMPPTPVGPEVASSDLRPFLVEATTVTYGGCLQCMNVPSPLGSYNAWSLTPAGPSIGAEVDIRQCRTDVRGLQGQMVVVQGRLIDRGRQHLPLLVADRITSEDQQLRSAAVLPVDVGLE